MTNVVSSSWSLLEVRTIIPVFVQSDEHGDAASDVHGDAASDEHGDAAIRA